MSSNPPNNAWSGRLFHERASSPALEAHTVAPEAHTVVTGIRELSKQSGIMVLHAGTDSRGDIALGMKILNKVVERVENIQRGLPGQRPVSTNQQTTRTGPDDAAEVSDHTMGKSF